MQMVAFCPGFSGQQQEAKFRKGRSEEVLSRVSLTITLASEDRLSFSLPSGEIGLF